MKTKNGIISLFLLTIMGGVTFTYSETIENSGFINQESFEGTWKEIGVMKTTEDIIVIYKNRANHNYSNGEKITILNNKEFSFIKGNLDIICKRIRHINPDKDNVMINCQYLEHHKPNPKNKYRPTFERIKL